MAAADPMHVDRINELHLINKFQQGDRRYRLLPTQVDRAAMTACVDGMHGGRVTGAVGDAYQFFRSRLPGHQELLNEAAGDEAEVERYVAELARRARHLELILSPGKESYASV